MQPVFLAELLQQLKQAGIGTALDTVGAVPSEAVAEALAYTDTVLLDIKMPDQKRYKKYIGGDLGTTMDFLHQASAAGCRIWIRHVVWYRALTTIRMIWQDFAVWSGKRSGACYRRLELLPYHGGSRKITSCWDYHTSWRLCTRWKRQAG
jgi:pyruvate formate lyase activating enzyme